MSREIVLDQWLQDVLGAPDVERLPLSNDASFRKYYRIVLHERSYVVMDAPSPENPSVFCDVALMLKSNKVKVPDILQSNLSQGFLLLSDFGDRLYLKELNEATADKLYQDAFLALLQIQACKGSVPEFDKAFLSRQMDVFKEWYLERHLDIRLLGAQLKLIASLLDTLIQVIESQPKVFVHRDYHSRNLMILEHGNPGVLDFQDAMIGPITYDLVSLLQDCYIAWPRSQVEVWVARYQDVAQKAGLLSKNISREEFLRWFDLTGLQRHLKNLGIFSRLYYRDGKAHYLKDIPLVCRYIRETYQRFEELKPYASVFDLVLSEDNRVKCAP